MRSELVEKYSLAGSIAWQLTLSHGSGGFQVLGLGTGQGQNAFPLAYYTVFGESEFSSSCLPTKSSPLPIRIGFPQISGSYKTYTT